MSRKQPRRGQRGSRRWRKLRDDQRRAESRHRRTIRQAHHEAAKAVVAWAVEHKVGTLVVGHPKGIAARKAGRIHNRRVTIAWRRTHLTRALADKAERAGMEIRLVSERGTSSTCPACRARQRPRGRCFACSCCGLTLHRDLVGAINIGTQGGGRIPTAFAVVMHRRSGVVPLRRDRRRQLMDEHRLGASGLARHRAARGTRLRESPAGGSSRPGSAGPGTSRSTGGDHRSAA
jgi:putative transposase